jgi:hypothetical protein
MIEYHITPVIEGDPKMFKGKYAKYFTTDIKEESILPHDIIPGPTFGFGGANQIPGACANFGWNVIYKPYFIDRVAHIHAGDEYLCFLGGQVPDCFSNFDAEIDFHFGKEEELYTITEPTIVFIPKGTVHCPLEFRQVNQPLLFVMLLLTPEFSLTTIDGEKVSVSRPADGEIPKIIDPKKFPGTLKKPGK